MLKPGEDYTLEGFGDLPDRPYNLNFRQTHVMYVRQEKIRGKEWYVFVLEDENSQIQRFRTPVEKVKPPKDLEEGEFVIRRVIDRIWVESEGLKINEFLSTAAELAEQRNKTILATALREKLEKRVVV